MIYSLELALQNGSEHVKKRLEVSFYWLRERGYVLNIQEAALGDHLILTLCGPNRTGIFHDEDIIYIFQHQLAELLSDAIINHWEKNLIRKRVERRFKRLSLEEKEVLVERTVDFLRRCNNNEGLNMLLKFGRKNKISHAILEHLYSSNYLNIEGLINFCLKDYLKEIRFAVDLACEEIKNEKQYNEFIKLLKYFVESQPSRVVEVNVYLAEDGIFHLWDEKGRDIEQDFIGFFLDDVLSNETNLDDVLISILISLAPRRLIFHATGGLPENEAIVAIKEVFKDRILICRGCERCLAQRFSNEP